MQDIYDEFSNGRMSPAAIQSFVRQAYQTWQSPAPAYLLLLGDGHFDYRMNTGLSNYPNFVPPISPASIRGCAKWRPTTPTWRSAATTPSPIWPVAVCLPTRRRKPAAWSARSSPTRSAPPAGDPGAPASSLCPTTPAPPTARPTWPAISSRSAKPPSPIFRHSTRSAASTTTPTQPMTRESPSAIAPRKPRPPRSSTR